MPTDRMPIEDAERRGLRFGLGVASVFLLSQLVDWPLGYLSAILTSMLLQQPRALSFKAAFSTLLIATVILMAAAYWATFAINYPALFLSSLAVLLYAIFFYAADGGRSAIVLFSLLGLIIMPTIARYLPSLATALVGILLLNLAIAFAAAMIWRAILPSHVRHRAPSEAPPPPGQAGWKAAVMLLITFPIVAWFNLTEETNVLTLIFVVILVQQLSNAAIAKVGKSFVIANAAGGLVAVIAVEILVMTPIIPVMTAIIVAVFLIAGRLIFSGTAAGRLAAPASSGFIVILGGATAPYGDNTDLAFVERLTQIGEAVLYVLVAVTVLTAIWRSNPKDQETAAPAA